MRRPRAATHTTMTGMASFTKAVLEGLSCKAAFVRGAVTVDSLRGYVERHVCTWIRQHRDPAIVTATQIVTDGDSGKMPLATCVGTPPSPPEDVVRATFERTTVNAFSKDGARLWSQTMSAPVLSAQVFDLRGDGNHEVIVGMKTSVKVFDRAGTNIWSTDGPGKLRMLLIDHLLRHDLTLQVTALWNGEDESQSVISTYDASGEQLAAFRHHGHLQRIAIDRPTSRHNNRIVATSQTIRRVPIQEISQKPVMKVPTIDPTVDEA